MLAVVLISSISLLALRSMCDFFVCMARFPLLIRRFAREH